MLCPYLHICEIIFLTILVRHAKIVTYLSNCSESESLGGLVAWACALLRKFFLEEKLTATTAFRSCCHIIPSNLGCVLTLCIFLFTVSRCSLAAWRLNIHKYQCGWPTSHLPVRLRPPAVQKVRLTNVFSTGSPRLVSDVADVAVAPLSALAFELGRCCAAFRVQRCSLFFALSLTRCARHRERLTTTVTSYEGRGTKLRNARVIR